MRVQAGIPKTDDFNSGDNEGCGYFEVNQKTRRALERAKAFLRPVLNRPNLTVLTQAQVKRARGSRQARAPASSFADGGRSSPRRASR